MKSRIANRLLVRIGLVLALSLLAIASTGHAATHVDQVLPTLCTSSQLSFIGDHTEFYGTSIGARPSGSLWDYDVVMCPINRFRPGDEVEEIRILIQGDRATSGWCQLYEAPNHDREVAFDYPRTVSENRGIVGFEPPSYWARNGQLAVTARCLLYPGNSITSIEVIWDVR